MECTMKVISESGVQAKAVSSTNIKTRLNIDWRDWEVVSPVENQGYCEAFYAFSSLGSIESSFAIKTGEINVLSKQQIIDCSTKWHNDGCCSGTEINVYSYSMVHGLVSQYNYPYKEKRCKCDVDLTDEANGQKVFGFRQITKNDEIGLIRALSFIGPVSISIDANHDEFRFYKTGILNITDCSSTVLTAKALAVGYDLRSKPYLLVKSSYGTDWGDQGYFKIALFEKNMCGIASDASYPIPRLEGTNPTT